MKVIYNKQKIRLIFLFISYILFFVPSPSHYNCWEYSDHFHSGYSRPGCSANHGSWNPCPWNSCTRSDVNKYCSTANYDSIYSTASR